MKDGRYLTWAKSKIIILNHYLKINTLINNNFLRTNFSSLFLNSYKNIQEKVFGTVSCLSLFTPQSYFVHTTKWFCYMTIFCLMWKSICPCCLSGNSANHLYSPDIVPSGFYLFLDEQLWKTPKNGSIYE